MLFFIPHCSHVAENYFAEDTTNSDWPSTQSTGTCMTYVYTNILLRGTRRIRSVRVQCLFFIIIIIVQYVYFQRARDLAMPGLQENAS
jgi:hypothetical protein